MITEAVGISWRREYPEMRSLGRSFIWEMTPRNSWELRGRKDNQYRGYLNESYCSGHWSLISLWAGQGLRPKALSGRLWHCRRSPPAVRAMSPTGKEVRTASTSQHLSEAITAWCDEAKMKPEWGLIDGIFIKRGCISIRSNKD